MQTFWITKYALSGGIFSIESKAEAESFHAPGDWWVRDTRPNGSWMHFRKSEAFDTRDGAIADAEIRRQRKIASLKKQIAKLEKLTF